MSQSPDSRNESEKKPESPVSERRTEKLPRPKARLAKRRALELRLQGMTYVEIAQDPGVQRHEATVRHWFWDDPSNKYFDPKLTKELDRLEEDRLRVVCRTVAKHVRGAILVLVQIMGDRDQPAMARVAAAEALYHKAFPKEGGDLHLNLSHIDKSQHIHLEKKSNEELILEADAFVQDIKAIGTEQKAIANRIIEASAALGADEADGACEIEGDAGGASPTEISGSAG